MRSSALLLLASSLGLITVAGRSEGKYNLITKPNSSLLTYNSQLSKNGSIKSPDYPYSAFVEVNRTYIFQGNEDTELVQIIFENFNLYKKDPNVQCTSEDSRLVYGRKDASTVVLCGQNVPLPILADSRHFQIQYIQATGINEDEIIQYGFNASYRFVTNFGIDTGQQTRDKSCEFIFDSALSRNGTIYSPNFPGPYLCSMECFYTFTGTARYINFQFTNFSLYGSDDCSRDDYIEIRESNDDDPKYFYEKKCGTHDPFVISVNSSSLFIVFRSTDKYFDSGQQMQRPFVGFQATYSFTNDTISIATITKLETTLLLVLLFIWTWNVF